MTKERNSFLNTQLNRAQFLCIFFHYSNQNLTNVDKMWCTAVITMTTESGFSLLNYLIMCTRTRRQNKTKEVNESNNTFGHNERFLFCTGFSLENSINSLNFTLLFEKHYLANCCWDSKLRWYLNSLTMNTCNVGTEIISRLKKVAK